MSRSRLPALTIYPHADCEGIDLDWLQAAAIRALPYCLASPGGEEPVLEELDEIEVSLVTDGTIAEVHGEFMDDPTPTDVITFHHGEILVSLDTARREGPRNGNSALEETLLYIVHGLLHLNGHTDLKEPDRTAMHREQEGILERLRTRDGA
ncbi:MAG TPA: rRNA maturation RNase YbeY [Bacteroidia bacterium]|nr:rRNA maturation RNase YbeY [Bacteroidia bacterium]